MNKIILFHYEYFNLLPYRTYIRETPCSSKLYVLFIGGPHSRAIQPKICHMSSPQREFQWEGSILTKAKTKQDPSCRATHRSCLWTTKLACGFILYWSLQKLTKGYMSKAERISHWHLEDPAPCPSIPSFCYQDYKILISMGVSIFLLQALATS